MPRGKKARATKRKAAPRKQRAAVEGEASAKAKGAKATAKNLSKKPSTNATASNRAEGIRLFNLANRPTKEQFQLVYGERGHLMTWAQRAEAGVPAEKFQAALAAKQAPRHPSSASTGKDKQ